MGKFIRKNYGEVMKNRQIYFNLIFFMSLCINNLLAVPILLYSLFKKKESIFLLALFLGMLGFYFQNTFEYMDLGFYYYLFEDEKLRNIILDSRKDIYVDLLMNFLIKNKLSPYILPFSSAFLSYYFLLKSLCVLLKNRKIESKKYITFYLMYLMIIPILGYTGIRMIVGISLFVYSMVLKYELNKKYYIFFMLLSPLCHISIVLPIFLLLFNEYFFKKINNKILKIILFISLCCGLILDKLIIVLYENINFFKFIPQEYIFGEWGLNNLIRYNRMWQFIIIFIWGLQILILLYYLFLNNKNKINKYIYILCVYEFLFIKFFDLFRRYFNISLFLIFLFSISNDLYKKYKIKYNIFYFILLFYGLCNIIIELRRYHEVMIPNYILFLKGSILGVIIKIIN